MWWVPRSASRSSSGAAEGDPLHRPRASRRGCESAYTLTFGGLLLLGARTWVDPRPPPHARRRHRAVHGRLARPAAWRRPPRGCSAARAVQGVGAAIAAPSTLALLTTKHPRARERARAIAYWRAVAGGGARRQFCVSAACSPTEKHGAELISVPPPVILLRGRASARDAQAHGRQAWRRDLDPHITAVRLPLPCVPHPSTGRCASFGAGAPAGRIRGRCCGRRSRRCTCSPTVWPQEL